MEQMTNDTSYWKERLSAHDTISRQAAIDALMPIYKSASLRNRNVFSTARKCMAAIEELPSAQPEIIHCESCEHWKNEHICECLSRHGTFETPKNFYCGYGKAK